jgi:hypothetical protein
MRGLDLLALVRSNREIHLNLDGARILEIGLFFFLTFDVRRNM